MCRARQEPLCPYHCAKGTWRGCGWLASRPQQRTLLRLPQNIRAATALGSLPASSTSPPTAVMILRDEEPATPPARRRRRGRADPAPDGPPPLLDESSLAAPLTGITMDQVRAEIAKAIPPVRENLIVQPRRRVAHEIGVPEAQNEVHRWRTTCGWGYGWSSYYRVQADSLGPELRRCKRCFPEAGCPSSSSSSSSSSSGSSSS